MRNLFIVLFFLTFFYFMTIQNWGSLQKSATDDETIEQAIARLIAVHEADSTSHLGVGESLQAHKNADIIDHPLGSVVGDKMGLANFTLSPNFESLDRYTIVASSNTPKLSSIDLFTSTVTDNVAYLIAPGASGAANYDPIYYNTIQFSLTLFTNSNIEVYAGAGDLRTSEIGPFVGFKIVNSTLYACERQWAPSGLVEFTEVISGVTVNTRHNYRVEVNPTDGKFYFYVDGVQVADMDIHSNDDNALAFFSVSVKTTNTTAKQVRFGNVYFARDFN
jgi:hypothetical protein